MATAVAVVGVGRRGETLNIDYDVETETIARRRRPSSEPALVSVSSNAVGG